ncbi:MAG TPA: LamG domain-containing protein [Candidatus Hydrogenedentes bacterium]|nr:LamG domain-containing protein [Candidatus Hydrogenedentota bacterium]HOV73523.1 LamG domain-containing protein [Candidatus Hydrogenedentota bacterium]
MTKKSLLGTVVCGCPLVLAVLMLAGHSMALNSDDVVPNHASGGSGRGEARMNHRQSNLRNDIAVQIAEPVAYWPLVEDARDHSGNSRHADNHGVVFDVPAPDKCRAARFDGKSAYLEVPAAMVPSLGTSDFTICVAIFVEDPLDDAPGDLLSCFDPDTRTGLNLGMATYSGVSNSQPNYRNIFFGIDSGRLDPQWTDCGRPGNAVLVFGFAVYEDALYAGTCEPHEGGSGHVYRYEGHGQWTDCGSPDTSNAVGALAVCNGRLYAGTSRYDTTGSAMPPSPNTTPGGKIFRYEGGRKWTFCGALSNPETGSAATLGGLVVYRGALHATTLKREGFGLYRHEGGDRWIYCGHPGRRVLNPCVFNGALYMVSYDAPGGPFRYDGETFDYVGATLQPPIHQDYSFAIHKGLLHLSTWPNAHVYRMKTDGSWDVLGKPGDELETMGMMVYNGKLYTGSLPSACVYRLDGHNSWTPIGQPLDVSDNKYRRAWSMALYKGKLFCGTLPSGRVFSIEAGRNVTLDRALRSGWRHIAAVRRGDRLFLYVDGKPVGSSTSFDPAAYDLRNGQPLRIGWGSGDYFNGWMRDLRIYRHAIPESMLRRFPTATKHHENTRRNVASQSHKK